LGITIIVAIATLVVRDHNAQFLMAMPFALALFLCFVETQHANLMALGGYKAVLEEAIERRTGCPVSTWESTIAPRMHAAIPIASFRVTVVVVYLASIGVAVHEAFLTLRKGHWGHEAAHMYVALTIVSILIGSLAALLSVRAASRQFDRVASITREGALPAWTRIQHDTSSI
jgi:hypothetical protein